MKNTFKLILVLAVVTSFAFMEPAENDPKKIIHIVIDAGHGGSDNGMTVDGFTEKEIVASIAQKIKANNTDKNVVLHFTRTVDSYISLQERTSFINNLKPDLVLSLHVNGNKNTATSGLELYVSPKNAMYEKSKKIADDLNARLVSNNNVKSRGVNEANFTMLTASQYPSITVEIGFLSNANDRAYLTNVGHHEKIANTILEAIYAIR